MGFSPGRGGPDATSRSPDLSVTAGRGSSALPLPHPTQEVAHFRSFPSGAPHFMEAELLEQLPGWRLQPLVQALMALRGVQQTVAITTVAEIGDLTRFDSPRQLAAFVGLIPSEHSSGPKRRQGAITKAGNGYVRRALVEGAWTYRYPAKVSEHIQKRIGGLPKPIQAIAWKAQLRLCKRYRGLVSRGKHPNVVVTAIAREMLAFMWAIAKQLPPAA